MKEQLIIYPEFDERIERDFLYTVSVTQGDRTERLTDGCLAWFHSPISPSSVASRHLPHPGEGCCGSPSLLETAPIHRLN